MRYSTALSIVILSLVLTACASEPAPVPAAEASNTSEPVKIVLDHLKAVEAGDWKTAYAQLDPDFTMQIKGMPFFVKIPYEDALDMHKARKRAFPDFRFNEEVKTTEGNAVKIAVFLTGTHTGYLDYPIDEVPEAEATGRTIDLPAEYFTYYVEGDRIVKIYGEIPEGHGPPALKKQLGLETD